MDHPFNSNDIPQEDEHYLFGSLQVRVVSEVDLMPLQGRRLWVSMGGDSDCGPG